MGHRHTVVEDGFGARRVRCETPDGECATYQREAAAGELRRQAEAIEAENVVVTSSDGARMKSKAKAG